MQGVNPGRTDQKPPKWRLAIPLIIETVLRSEDLQVIPDEQVSSRAFAVSMRWMPEGQHLR